MAENRPEDDIDWAAYYDMVGGRPPRDTAVRLAELLDDRGGGLVADLGCGDGVEAVFFAKAGWRTLAIDAEPEAIDRVTARASEEDIEGIVGSVMSFSELDLPEIDAVHASYSLPFCPPDAFDQMWDTIVDALRPGGVMAVVLFGVNDGWADSAGMTFLTRNRVDALVDGLELVDLIEVDEDGEAASGPKHWHTFTIYARKHS